MIKVFIVTGAIFFIVGCSSDSIDKNLTKKNINDILLKDTIPSTTIFNDTTINGKLILKNAESIINTLGNIDSNVMEPDTEAPNIFFKNKSGNEYLKMIMWYGNGPNQFSYFTVGYIGYYNGNSEIHPSNFEKFITESGVNLGMQKDSIILLKGSSYSESIEDSFEMLRYFEEQLYEAKYYFRNDSLIKFSFGYIYP